MNRKTIVAICSVVAVSAFIILQTFIFTSQPVLWEDDFENNLFMFDSSRHVVHGLDYMALSVGDIGTFEDFDAAATRHPSMAIIIGEVAGPSINRIIDPIPQLRDFSIPSGCNHVITPILVHHIIHLGDDIKALRNIKVGEIVDVMEGYFYVTPITVPYTRGVPLGEIVPAIFGGFPMETGNRYLIYFHHGGGPRPDRIYNYNNEHTFNALRNNQVYLLDPTSSRSRLDIHPESKNPRGWHEAAMAMYGHLYFELPATPPPPVVIPRTPDELNIIIQGAPIATAIYDAAGNRLIQDGLGLYRQTTGGGRERVGQRVSISHALRRFQYILEPGEYIFKDLNFAETNLPSNVQVLGFENSERVALAYYADSPSSSQMELRIMPSGTVELIDKTTNTIIPPTEIYPPPAPRRD